MRLPGTVLEGDQGRLPSKELWELGLVDLPAQCLVQALVVHENELQTHCGKQSSGEEERIWSISSLSRQQAAIGVVGS